MATRLGKTEVKGHGLLHEGRPSLDAAGRFVGVGSSLAVRGACRCGMSAPVSAGVRGTQRWHVEHKATIVRGRQEAYDAMAALAELQDPRLSIPIGPDGY